MCRLIALTSDEPQSPILAIRALDVMREGHDGSGVGLFLSDLSGPFEELKGLPILSGIFTAEGVKRLDEYMTGVGFMPKLNISIRNSKLPPAGTPRRDTYVICAYECPQSWRDWTRMKSGRAFFLRASSSGKWVRTSRT